jgi:hypothetical protein
VYILPIEEQCSMALSLGAMLRHGRQLFTDPGKGSKGRSPEYASPAAAGLVSEAMDGVWIAVIQEA